MIDQTTPNGHKSMVNYFIYKPFVGINSDGRSSKSSGSKAEHISFSGLSIQKFIQESPLSLQKRIQSILPEHNSPSEASLGKSIIFSINSTGISSGKTCSKIMALFADKIKKRTITDRRPINKTFCDRFIT